MKTGTCVKCSSDDILRIDGRDAGDHIAVGVTIFSMVMVTRYMCVACGYSEEWIDKPEHRAKLVDRYRY